MKTTDKTKLTLSCDKEIIKEAKQYAALEEDSLSSIIEDFLATYVKVKKNKARNKGVFHDAEVQDLAGSFKLGKHRNYKKEYKS